MRLGLTHKIFGGYLVLISTLVGIGGFGGLTLYRLTGEYQSLVDEGLPKQRILYSLEELFRRQSANEKKFVVLGNPAISELFSNQNRKWETLAETLSYHIGRGPGSSELNNLRYRHKLYGMRVLDNMAMRAKGKSAGGKRRSTGRFIRAINQDLQVLSITLRQAMEMRLQQTQDRSERIIAFTVGVGLIVIVLGLFAAYGLSSLLTRPVRRLQAATGDVAQGIFDRKVPVESHDEIGDLAASFNAMAEQLASLESLREEFIAYISHELKTPLTSLKEANALLSEGVAGPVSAGQTKLLGVIQDDCNKLERLISELLDLSKMEAGMMPFNMQVTRFFEPVAAAVEEQEPVAKGQGVTLTVSGSDTPLVMADTGRLRQVMTNLISNAIKFSPVGAQVSIDWQEEDGHLFCHVRDQGPGVPEEARELIFEKFHQLAPNALSGVRGTGLGLPIARKIVESHGGVLLVECPPEGGSVFWFSLPLHPDRRAISRPSTIPQAA